MWRVDRVRWDIVGSAAVTLMADGEAEEFRCFVGGLSWSTTDKALEDAFRPFGSVLEAKVMPFSQAISSSL